MKKGSTLFLRAALVGIAVFVLGLCALVLPAIHGNWNPEFPNLTTWRYPFMAILAATVVPFFVALYQAMKLLGFIDKGIAFSQISVKALKNIKYSALAIGGLYVLALPVIYFIAEHDDAPGLILIFGTIFIGMPVVLAVFTALIQNLLQNIIDIKSENDLTV